MRQVIPKSSVCAVPVNHLGLIREHIYIAVTSTGKVGKFHFNKGETGWNIVSLEDSYNWFGYSPNSFYEVAEYAFSKGYEIYEFDDLTEFSKWLAGFVSK